jgi:hypothetical protein
MGHRNDQDDSGLTTVELIVYVVISSLFLSLLAMLFVNGLQVQAATTDRDTATGTGGVVGSSLTTSIRNASEFTVVNSGTVVVAKVATGATGWQCRAWAVDGGELRYRASSGAISTADTSSWTTLAPEATATLAGGAAFATDGARGLRIGLTISTGDTTIPFSNGVTAQAVNDGTDTTACW